MDKSVKKISEMFDEIAGTYDILNHSFTLNLDQKWRKQIVKYIKKNSIKFDTVLDIASGTGDLTKALLKLDSKVIYATDISPKMLEVQKKKFKDERLKIEVADALNLPFKSNSIDIVTIGVGVRNFENLEKGLKEIHRVLKKGGYLIVLEMFGNKGFKKKIFDLYFGKIMPKVGNRVSGSKHAYSYLFNSVKNFHSVEEFVKLAESRGYKEKERVNNFLDFVFTTYLEKT